VVASMSVLRYRPEPSGQASPVRIQPRPQNRPTDEIKRHTDPPAQRSTIDQARRSTAIGSQGWRLRAGIERVIMRRQTSARTHENAAVRGVEGGRAG
jgi:hypothetical protein